MTKHLLVLIVVILFSSIVKSQTKVSGNITGNTTWTKSKSPYILTGNVGVPSAYTLTIEPGVTVQRSDNYQIIINGAVRFDGTSEDSIDFLNGYYLNVNSKYFIEFQKSNLSHSSLSYLSFQSSYGMPNHIKIGNENEDSQTNPKNSGILNIIHSNLSNGYTATNGYYTTASVNIDSCIIVSGYIWGYGPNSERINISNSQIYNSTVRSDYYNRGISFTNCYLNGVDLPLGFAVGDPNLTFTNSTVENSKIGDNSNYFIQAEGPIEIIGSTFNNTSIDGYKASCIATNSNFTVTDKLTTLSGFKTDYMFNVGYISLSNCKLTNNSNYNISGIYLTGYVYSGFGSGGNIVHNQFTNLYDAITVNNFDAIRLDSNNFSIPGRYDIVNQSPKDFSALYDYFQLKEGQTIDNLIYDQNDDLNYGLVTYIPNITGPVVLPVTSLNLNGSTNGHTVKLNWQTSKEINTVQYVVERKVNNGFVAVGTVAAATNSDNVNNYSFTDLTPATGTNYYRIKIMDNNGKYTYSIVVPVMYTGIVKGLSIYPNPAKTYVIVEHGVVNSTTQLMLVDMQGRKIKTSVIANGTTQTKVDITNIAHGTYRIVWQSGRNTISQGLLIQ